jgi:hypothetical protein
MIRKLINQLLVLLLSFSASGFCDDDVQQYQEYQVKAMMIIRLAEYTGWPDGLFENDGNGPVIIGILGRNPFGMYLELVTAQSTIKGRNIKVIYLEDSMARLDDCHILFLTRDFAGYLDAFLEVVQGKNILTFGDTEGFAERGVMFNLVVRRGKVGFEINRNATRNAGYVLDSRLLSLALRTLPE